MSRTVQLSIIRVDEKTYKVSYQNEKEITATYFLDLNGVLSDLVLGLRSMEITKWAIHEEK